MKAYEYRKFGLENLTLVEREKPRPAAREVVVKFHAASLNYRDLMFARGLYNPNPQFPAVPLSDGAGEVVEIGAAVTRWKVGDKVMPTFFQNWVEGEPTVEKTAGSLGAGELDGVLREFGAFPEDGLVRMPSHLSFEEAATLPCAALTAWNALVVFGKVKAGDTVLTLGTGGVSLFALQFAKLHGARVIATSSSDEKLARLRKLGASETVNYKQTPEWDKEVLRLTNNVGVDHVVELGGAGTMAKSANSARLGGRMSVIGVLTEGAGLSPIHLIRKSLRVQGIYVGSREMFEAMNRAIEANQLRPVADKTFPFAEARQALEFLQSGKHFGKVVIRF